MKQAKVQYHQLFEPFSSEGYSVEILVNGSYELDAFYPLVSCGNGDKNFINFSIINKIAELTELGYHISYQ